MTHRSHRAVAVLGVAVAVGSVAVPHAWGLQLHAPGLAQAVLGSALLVVCSTLALQGSRPRPLPTRAAVPAVLATTAANAVTPAGIGGSLLVLRVHRQSGLCPEQAGAAVALRTAFAGLASLLTAVVAVTLVGAGSLPSPRTGLLAVAALALLVAGGACVPAWRRRVLSVVRRTAGALGDVLRRPRCLASLLVGCLGVSIAQVITLQGALAAVGHRLPWPEVLATLVGSAAARSAVPSPGGVGPIEAALVGSLTALGLGFGAASAAVAIYRTAGHWLPVVAGVVSLGALRRRHLL